MLLLSLGTMVYVLAPHTAIASAQKINFAGFAFLGDFSQRENLYPYSTKILALKEGRRPALEVALQKAIKGHFNNKNLNLSLELSSQKNISKAIAFAVSNESVQFQGLNNGFNVIYLIFAQILVFDFDEAKVIANFPVAILHSEFVRQKPDAASIQTTFKGLYLDVSRETNIFRRWVARLNKINPKTSYGNYCKITEVQIDPRILKDSTNKIVDVRAFELQLAQFFESVLSTHQQIPMVPYTKGEAIGAKMPARFANGTSVQFQLPAADYGIKIGIRPFKTVKKDSKNYSKIIFASFASFKVEQPDTGKSIIDGVFRNIPIVTIDRSRNVVLDQWYERQKSLRSLFAEFSKQISVRDESWLKKSTRIKDVSTKLGQLEKTLASCR
jgi:hypothetical protein